MNAQERTLLTNLLQNLREAANGTTSLAKDPEAAQLINDTLAAAPDAAYVLAQRHLLLEMALERAQAQIQTLQSNTSSSFLGGQPAHSVSNDSTTQTNAYGQPIGQSTPAPLSPSMASASAPPPPARSNFGGGSFLGTAAATATGVLGGALLFQGIEHLMGGGLGSNAMAGELPVDHVTNVTENFYGTDPNASDSMDSSGWNNGNMADLGNSAFDDPAANPIDPSSFNDDGLVDLASNQTDDDGSGGGFFDGLFGGGDDDWV